MIRKEEKEVRSWLEIKDIYVLRSHFNRWKKIKNRTKLHITYYVDYNEKSDREWLVTIECNIEDTNHAFDLNIAINGEFELPEKLPENISNDEKDIIFKSNTIAILFPYLRSQVTLLTNQPNFTPIILPLVDGTKFVSKKQEANNEKND